MSLLTVRVYVARAIVFLFSPFPCLFRGLYYSFRWFVTRLPFLPGEVQWKAVQTTFWNFEWKRRFYRSGRQVEDDRLVSLAWNSGPKLEPGQQALSGSFKVIDTHNSLVLLGRIRGKHSIELTLKIDGRTLRKVKTIKGGIIKFHLKPGALATFPGRAILGIEDQEGRVLPYRHKYAAVELDLPWGDGSIFSRLGEGKILNKKGRIEAETDRVDQKRAELLALYQQVRAVLSEHRGIDLLVMYGSLLGCIREGDFIANDDDFDAGYVSTQSDPKRVREETLDLMYLLANHGFLIRVSSTGRLFKLHDGRGHHIDIMPIWFEGSYMVGYRGISCPGGPEDFLPARDALMSDQGVLVPKRAEHILEGYYGKDWRTPNPGYVSTSGQTGIQLNANYQRFLLPPREYFRLEREYASQGLAERFLAPAVVPKF